MIKISIIIPVYGVEPYIEDCIRSIMAQDYQGSLECILVDDCGPDKSIEVAERVISNYTGPIDFRILHHEYNRGVSAARNTGMRDAKGEYIYFVDSDDEITPDCISSLSELLKERDYDMVVGDHKVVGIHQELLQLKMATGEAYYDKMVPWSYYKGKWNMFPVNKLYNLSYLKRENLTFKEGLIYEDELWCLEIAATAKSIVGLKKETYIYKIREKSITTSDSNFMIEKKLKILMTIHKEYYNFAVTRNILTSPPYLLLYAKCFDKVLRYARKISEEKERQTLLQLQNISHISLWHIIRLNKLNLKSYIKNLHVASPEALGWLWYSKVHKPILKMYVAVKDNMASLHSQNVNK